LRLRRSRLRDFHLLHAWLVAEFHQWRRAWQSHRSSQGSGSIENWTGVCL
jgi:hypothetical protein